MTVYGFGLVLAAAFCHAIWNLFVKRINGGPELVWLFSVISVVLYLPVAIFILATKSSVFGVSALAFISGSALLHLGYFLLLQQGYRRGDLSLVYPTARATAPLLSTAIAVLVLDERVTHQIAAGGAAVIVGVIFLTGGMKGERRNLTKSLLFGLGAGTLISSYTVWDAYAVSAVLVPPLLLDYASCIGRSVVLAPIAARRKTLLGEVWRRHRFGVLTIAVFNPLAYILVLYALTFTPVVYVAPTREVSVLLTVLMGTLWLKEGELKPRIAWAALIVTGVGLLATA
jgi:drug/metabolite transporter (DMT)-like permease